MQKKTPSASAAGRVAALGTLLVGASGAAALLTSPAGASAQTFTVENLNDNGPGSLRAALLDANANPGADTVVFDVGVTGTITLTTGKLVVSDSVTVVGPGSGLLNVEAATDKIFYLYNGSSSMDVSISGMTLTGGASAMFSWSTNLTLDDIHASGSTTDPLLEVESNHSDWSQSLTIRNSSFTDATTAISGAGIHVSADFGHHAITIDGTTIADNTSTGGTGGLRLYDASSVTITDSLISGNSGNTGGGGAWFGFDVGSVVVTSTTVDGNSTTYGWGGGLYANSDSFVMVDSTVSNNVASACGGGGLEFDSDATVATVSNSTITGNSGVGGGGIRLEAIESLTVNQSTITGNASTGTDADQGGGILMYSSGYLFLSGTIVAGNTAGDATRADLATRDASAVTVASLPAVSNARRRYW